MLMSLNFDQLGPSSRKREAPARPGLDILGCRLRKVRLSLVSCRYTVEYYSLDGLDISVKSLLCALNLLNQI